MASRKVFLAAQWQACIDYDATERLPQCQVPIHVIAFSEDMQTPVPHGRRVAKLAPKGHFHLLDGLGHVSMAGHRAEEVNNCIRQIIESYA
jgi:pimeloyl-ACP methyl ester carboxylesterase